MNFLVAFNLLFLVCNAQENIKCFRSEERLTPIPPSTQQTLNQGVPGKRGPVGMKGDTGSDGMKGEKGAAGVPDRSAIESLRGKMLRSGAFCKRQSQNQIFIILAVQ